MTLRVQRRQCETYYMNPSPRTVFLGVDPGAGYSVSMLMAQQQGYQARYF